MTEQDYQMYKTGNRWKVSLASGDTLYHRQASALKRIVLGEYQSHIHRPVRFQALYVMAKNAGPDYELKRKP